MKRLLVLCAAVAACEGRVLYGQVLTGDVQLCNESSKLDLMLVLEEDGDVVRDVARRVSDPKGAEYGAYKTSAEVRAMTSPTKECMRSLAVWASSAGVTLAPGTSIVPLQTTVARAAQLFNTTFHETVIDSTTYRRSARHLIQVPPCVRSVLGIFGLPPKALAPRQPRTVPLTDPVTPDTLKSLYRITQGINRTAAGTRAVVELSGQLVNKKDLATFFSRYVSGAEAGDDTIAAWVGQNYTPGASYSSLTELEYMMGVAPGVSTQYWSFTGTDFCQQLLTWLEKAVEAPVGVFSLAYGWQGDLDLVGCPTSAQNAVETSFARLAAIGSTVIMASGDNGAGLDTTGCTVAKPLYYTGDVIAGPQVVNSSNECCKMCGALPECTYWTANISYTGAPSQCSMFRNGTPHATPIKKEWFAASGGRPTLRLWPSWPSSSDFVTAVGGTSLSGNAEVSSTGFGSGGGFSEYLSIPGWQANAVQKYFEQPMQFPPNGTYPMMGRGVPDVALLAEQYTVISNGQPIVMQGTEASAAVFAGMISTLNSIRLGKGQPMLGSLNPWLYGTAYRAFRDITVGSNALDSFGKPLAYGWDASLGWDPVTGWGSPNFAELMTYI